MSWVESTRSFLGLVLLVFTVAMLAYSLYAIYVQSCAQEPLDVRLHKCKKCQSEFTCRMLLQPQPVAAAAAAATESSLQKPVVVRPRRTQPLNGFQRRTVNVGSFPVEVSETKPNATCCAAMSAKTKKWERYCSYKCYTALVR